ncbi:GIP [Symbiodinium sp. CCMP2592]|nr:GIP [Symbiodinium sp. CCMP2592]
MPPPHTWRDGNRDPAREAPVSETYSSSEEEEEEAEEEAPEGDATVRPGAPPPSGRVAKKSSAPPPPPAAAAGTLPPTAVPVAGLGAPPGPPPLPASPGQPTTIYPDGTAQQGLYTATGQFIGYFRVPVGVPMVIPPRVPMEANGEASAAASPGPAAPTAAAATPEPTAVKAEPKEKEPRHPKDKGDAKRAKEGRERPEKESANKKDKRDRDPKKDKRDRDPKKEKKDRDNQKEKKETRVPEPKAYPLKKDKGDGRVKDEPKEPRERRSPSFEREFLPQARAKSGAWKPYNDTWFDYDGRDERLYPERTGPGDGPGYWFFVPGPAGRLQAPYPAEDRKRGAKDPPKKKNRPGKKQRERRKYAVRRDRGSDSRASPEKKRPRKTAKSEEASPPLPPPATPPPDPSPTSPADRYERRHGDPSPSDDEDEDDGDEDGEGEGHFAEEETLTDDPTVTPPDTPAPSEAPAQRAEPLRAAQAAPAKAPSRPASNRSHGKASAGSQGMPRDGAPVKAGGPPLPPPLSDRIIDDNAVTPLGNRSSRSQRSDQEWNPKKGPAPGIHWRGGAPPQPPKYDASARDVGSFDHYARRVRLWSQRVAAWMPDGDAALLLVESLTGLPERELEFVPLSTIEEGGVEGVLKRLESAASDALVYRKHHYLRTWESIRRHGGESMQAYVHRFDQTHKQLGANGAHCSGQSFEWIPIRDSLLLQYPDTLPVPPSQAKGREKGKGKDAKRVHLTEAPDEATGEAAEPQAEDAELEEISKAMEVLTVTAQKLKSFTQGRRWTDGKGTGSTSSTGQPKGKGKGASRVHVAEEEEAPHEGGYEEPPPEEQAYDDQPYDEYYDAAKTVSQVLTNAPETAYLAHCATLRPFGLSCKWLPESERFKFGAGKPAMSSASLAIPAGIDGRPMVLVASLLAAEIPLLASLKMLKQLGAVLDLPSEKAFLGSLQIEVPLHVTLGGHLAICVTSFPVDGLPCDLDRWHYRRAPTEEVLFGPAKSEQNAASADNHGLSESEALQVRPSAEVRASAAVGSSPSPASGVVAPTSCHARTRSAPAPALAVRMASPPGGGPHLEEPPLEGADAPELPARSGLGEEHAAGIDPPSNGHRGKLHASDQRDQPLWERNWQVRPVQGVGYPVEVARRPRWLGLLASVTWAVYSALANADYGCGPEHGPRYEGQSQGSAQGTAFEYPFLGELPTLPSSDPQGTSGVRPVEPRIGDELRAGRLERARVLRLDSDFLKTGQRKRLAGVARKAGAALGLELSTLRAELAKAVNARRKIDYDHDLMQVTPCDSKGNVEALGLKGVEETWDVASHRGRKKLTEALDYYKPLVLAVRLTSSPAHSDPEVSKAALKALEKQQRRGHYWTLIAPPDHTVWRNQNVSRLLSSSHAHVTQAEERVTANHEWLAQPTPEATPAGLAYRVRRVVRELEPTRFRREKQRPLRAPACGTWDRVSTKPPFHETYYLDYVQDDREWRGVMDQVEQVFRTSASPQITLTPGHEIWKRISEMIPWRIERVQLAKAPKARRFPRDIPFTHRATVNPCSKQLTFRSLVSNLLTFSFWEP